MECTHKILQRKSFYDEKRAIVNFLDMSCARKLFNIVRALSIIGFYSFLIVALHLHFIRKRTAGAEADERKLTAIYHKE